MHTSIEHKPCIQLSWSEWTKVHATIIAVLRQHCSMGGGDGVGGDNNKLLGIISLLKWFAVYELDTICKHTNACKSLINNNDCAKKHLVSFVYHLWKLWFAWKRNYVLIFRFQSAASACTPTLKSDINMGARFPYTPPLIAFNLRKLHAF